MKARSLLMRAGACLLLLFADRALAILAIEINAAGALLSPGGVVDLEALVVAGLFISCRLLLALVFCVALAWTASDVVGAVLGRFAAGSSVAERTA